MPIVRRLQLVFLSAQTARKRYRTHRLRPVCRACKRRCLSRELLDYVECVRCKRAMTCRSVFWRRVTRKLKKEDSS